MASVTFDPRVDDGYMKHFVPIPEAIARKLAGAKRLRGTLGEHPFRRAPATTSDGRPCLKFGVGWLRDAGLDVGDRVAVVVEVDPDPDAVDVPEELEAVLADDPELALAWESLTPGKRRTLVYPVTRAKRPATRVKRVAAVVEQVRQLMGDLAGC